MNVSIPELELQQEIQRFTTRFVDRITQGAEALQGSSRAAVRDAAMRKNLLYASSALEIATGASAAVNLLDMFVFVHLCRTVLERHWIPTLYKDDGRELDQAFTRSEDELSQITVRALGTDGHRQLLELVDTWLADNPGQTRVEGIRLADFSAAAGTAAANRALQARGLLSSVKVASEAANEAMVIAERGLFLLHRLPFLWRLQVRLGAREILNDTLTRVTTGPGAMAVARVAKTASYAVLLGVASIGLVWLRGRRRR